MGLKGTTQFVPPQSHRRDFEKAVRILQDEGCKEIYIFGSVAVGTGSDSSDLDLGIRGYPRNRFFRIYGRLISELDHQADLVDFEREESLFSVLNTVGEIQRIA